MRELCATDRLLSELTEGVLELLDRPLGEEDQKGHVEVGWEQEDLPGMSQKAEEEEASAEMYLVLGRGELAFPETLCMCQMLS